jgi:hypothetical protein
VDANHSLIAINFEEEMNINIKKPCGKTTSKEEVHN